MRQFVKMARQAFILWEQSRAATMGAALAYYTLFSIPPLLVIALAAVSLVFGQKGATGQMTDELKQIFGDDIAAAMQSMVKKDQQTGGGPLAMVFGVVVLLLGASGVFGELQASLNTIWQVQPKPGRGVLGIIKDRFLSFTLVLGTCFLLLVSLVVSTALSVISSWWTPELIPGGTYLWQGIHAVVGFGVITLLFAFIYRFLPDAKIAWKDVWVGSAVTTVLFLAGKQILGLYLAQKGVSSSYGAAGSLVLVLIWVYYTAQIFLLGAAFTRVYALRHGNRGEPKENAVPLASTSPCYPTPAKSAGS